MSQAQVLPDAGSVLRETERRPLRIPPTLAPRPATATPPPRPVGEVLFRVHRFELQGVQQVPREQLQSVLAGYLNRDIGFTDLELAMAEVARVYEAAGWLARVQVPEQDVVDGVVTLQVIEAKLGRIRVVSKDSPRLDEERVVQTMTARQMPGQPLSLKDMERAVSVLSDTPGATVTAALAPGASNAETDIVITVSDRDPLSGSVMSDNGGGRATGVWRATLALGLDNVLGWADQWSSLLVGSEGTQYAQVNWTMPWGYDGWRVGLSASQMHYRLIGRFAATLGEGQSSSAGWRATYPVHRSSTDNINASLSWDVKHFLNQANGVVTSRKAARVFNATLSGDSTDDLAGGGYMLWTASALAGWLDLSPDPANQTIDREGPRTEGRYLKASATASRLQRLSEQGTLWLSASGQRSNRNLDSSEKFSLGGPMGVRAYPVSEASGDMGWLTTVELRQQVSPEVQVFAFMDRGGVWLYRNASHVSTASTVPNHYSFGGPGMGLNVTLPSRATVRFAAAFRRGPNPAANPVTGADSDGSRPFLRAWLTASLPF